MRVIRGFWVISIVIDSDRGHSYEPFKKKSNYDENWARDMYLNICVCNEFWAARNGKKFWTFQAQHASDPYFVSKSSFRVLSKIKIIIFYQSKPILLYLKIKNSKICKLYVYYS